MRESPRPDQRWSRADADERSRVRSTERGAPRRTRESSPRGARPATVDDLDRRQPLLRIHAHVEGRVVGVGEASLGRVELERRDAEVHQTRSAVIPSSRSSTRASAKFARSAGWRSQLRASSSNRSCGERIAIDATRFPSARAARRRAARGPRLRTCSRSRSRRRRVEERDQLGGEDWYVLGRAGHMNQCGHLRTDVPRLGRPIAPWPAPRRSRSAGHRFRRTSRPSGLAFQISQVGRASRRSRRRRRRPGVFDQVPGDADPACGVERLVVRARRGSDGHHPAVAAERVELGQDLLLEPS